MSYTSKKQFPDFFTTNGPIQTTVIPLQFGKRIYCQATVYSEKEELEYISKPVLRPYTDNDEEMLDCADMEENYDITLTQSGKFFTSFYVPSSLLCYIIGAKGVKLKTLQRNTNTIIKIPRLNETGNITITGDTERKVASARTQIVMIVTQRRERIRPTHFIGIPVRSDELQNNLMKFYEEIMENPPTGVSEVIFQAPVKLHLTLVVLKLLDDTELNLAKKTLQDCYNDEISKIFPKNEKIRVTVQGVEIMNDDPTMVRVLYGKILLADDYKERVEKMSEVIVSFFCRAGVAKKEYDKVKLHLTLMNTSFRNEDEVKIPFDASGILEKYKNFYFGTFVLQELDLCIRGTTRSDTGEKKYYDTALTIPL